MKGVYGVPFQGPTMELPLDALGNIEVGMLTDNIPSWSLCRYTIRPPKKKQKKNVYIYIYTF